MIMHPSYSPLFTLGLLADPSTVPSPTEDSPLSPLGDDPSPIYFTLQTGKRDTIELRSFLYLDLADNKPHAPSHRRKYSSLSKSTSWTCTTDVKSVHDMARTVVPPMPTRRRTSKESLRTIPSPKPAPSATLPDLPIPAPIQTPSSPPKRHLVSNVATSLLSPTRLRRPTSLRSESISSNDRRQSRLDALACLEGRSRAPHRVHHPSSLRKNFMSFSDDEDEKSTMHKVSSSAPSTFASPTAHVDDASGFADAEDEEDAIASRETMEQVKPVRPAKPARKRRGTIESWFPLKSFIDLKDDDLSSWNWRSFIEIGGVA